MGARLRLAPDGLVRLLGLLVVVSGLLAVVEPAPAAAQSDARFIDTSAVTEFGESLAFSLVAESDTEIESVELYWRPEGDPELSAAYPEIEADQRVELVHEVDLTTQYLPPGLDIVYYWRVIDERGSATDSAEQNLFYMDDGPTWDTLSDGLVTVWWFEGDRAFADDLLDTANRTINGLSERFAVIADEPIRIVVYGDDDEFAEALPPNSAEWIGGQAYPGLNLIVALIEPGAGSRSEVRRMVPHEVSHLILDQATENPWNTPPNWLDEGLAVYNQETADRDLPEILDDAVDDGELIPIRALNSSFPLDPDQAYLSYAESHSIATFIIEELGEEQMAALIAVFRDEVSYDQAVERALGMTIEELDAAWKAWLGYEGDEPAGNPNSGPDGLPQIDDDDDTDFTTNERIFVLSCTGIFALAGLGLFVVAITKIRRMGGRG